MSDTNWGRVQEILDLYEEIGRRPEGIDGSQTIEGIRFRNGKNYVDEAGFRGWYDSGLTGSALENAFYSQVDAFMWGEIENPSGHRGNMELVEYVLNYYTPSGWPSSNQPIPHYDADGTHLFDAVAGSNGKHWSLGGVWTGLFYDDFAEYEFYQNYGDEDDDGDEDEDDGDEDDGADSDRVSIQHYDEDGNYIGTWDPGKYPEWDLEGNWIGSTDTSTDTDSGSTGGSTDPSTDTGSGSTGGSTDTSIAQSPVPDPESTQIPTEIDHMDFGIKVQIATKIFEFTDKAYYGELFPLFAKLFAIVDAIAQKGMSQVATKESLATLQVQAIVRATLAAVQIPTLIDLANSSLSVGPTNPASGGAFFQDNLLNKDVNLTMFTGISKGTYYRKYREYETQTINEIAAGTLDMLEPTGVSLTDPVALRNLTATTMAVVPRNEGSTGAANMDDSLAAARAFIAAHAYEKFCGWYLTLLLPAFTNLFRFYKEFPGQWAIVTELVSSWIIRDGGRYAVSDEAAAEYFTSMSNYVDSLEATEVYVPPLAETEDDEADEPDGGFETP